MRFASGKGTLIVLAMAAAHCDGASPVARHSLSLAVPAAAITAPGPAELLQPSLPTSIRVLVGGDVLPHRPSLSTPSRVSGALAPLSPLMAGVDVAVANYETATGDARFFGTGKSISLAAPAEWMGEIGASSFRALTVANNHACDLGKSGFEATLEAARSNDVIALGGDRVDPWRARVLVEKAGHRVCAIAWTTLVNGGGSCKRSGELAVAGFDRMGTTRIEHAVARAKVDGCDAIVAILHGGREYAPQIWGPRMQARHAAEAGVDAVVIHHPHVPSPVDVVTTADGRRVPVFDSVGNLVSNQGESWQPTLPPQSRERLISLNAWTRVGVLADLQWTWSSAASPQTDTPAEPRASRASHPVLTWGYHLLWTENDHAAHRNDPMPNIEVRPLDPIADHPLIERLATDEQGPKRLFFDGCWLEATKSRCDTTLAAVQNQPIF